LSGEPFRALTSETIVTREVGVMSSTEVLLLPNAKPTTESVIVEVKPEKPLEEGDSYKGVPWGADFRKFKEIKKNANDLIDYSAAFVSTTDDIDIALILGTPLSKKVGEGGQRVLFEYVPQRFASVYYEPDDVYYIFYDGKYVMAFSRIIEANFDLYRDNLYKKYKKSGGFSKQFVPAANKKYNLDVIRFTKGKTNAFIIRSKLVDKKKTITSAKLLFVAEDFFKIIEEEIRSQIESGLEINTVKAKQALEKDLNKIE
jgi:hypothetical protein